MNGLDRLNPQGQGQVAPLQDVVQGLVEDSRSFNTRRAYAADWAAFADWCSQSGAAPLPADPSTVAAYIAHLVSTGYEGPQGRVPYAFATIARRVTSIAVAHTAARQWSPTQDPLVQSTLEGVQRRLGAAPRKATPVRARDLGDIVRSLPNTPRGHRDRALLLLGYVLALRRSELSALNVEDLQFTPQGVTVTVRRSKTDQAGLGARFGIPYHADKALCPVRALQAWTGWYGIQSGPLFRGISRHGVILPDRLSDRGVARAIQSYAPWATGHSLRAGFVTDAFSAGLTDTLVSARSRHQSPRVLAGYRREANLYAVDYLQRITESTTD